MATAYAEKSVARVETTGSVVEAAGGLAVIVLAIIGLTRTDAGSLASIAVIILGAALLAEGSTVATEFSRLFSMSSGGTSSGAELGSGMFTEVIVGAGIVILGVLALLGVSATTLVPVAVIATGALMLVFAPSVQRMSEVRMAATGVSENGQRLIQAAGSAAVGLQVLAGLAAIVLGILALTGTAAAGAIGATALVGLLVLGSSILVSASAMTGNMMRLFHH